MGWAINIIELEAPQFHEGQGRPDRESNLVLKVLRLKYQRAAPAKAFAGHQELLDFDVLEYADLL